MTREEYNLSQKYLKLFAWVLLAQVVFAFVFWVIVINYLNK